MESFFPCLSMYLYNRWIPVHLVKTYFLMLTGGQLRSVWTGCEGNCRQTQVWAIYSLGFHCSLVNNKACTLQFIEPKPLIVRSHHMHSISTGALQVPAVLFLSSFILCSLSSPSVCLFVSLSFALFFLFVPLNVIPSRLARPLSLVI